MPDILIKFKREDRDGFVAVGTYLLDAARRFGIRIDDDTEDSESPHACRVAVVAGAELLTEMTQVEREQFEKFGRKDNERLACQTRIEKAGEVVIMTDGKKSAEAEAEAKAAEDASERYRKEFEEMPLESKIANLLRLEVIALGETLSFVANSPFKVLDKVMDVMAEFGLKKDEAAKSAQRPAEHRKPNSKKAGDRAPKGAATQNKPGGQTT